MPPLDFTSASFAQQAFVPAGGGPPQQPFTEALAEGMFCTLLFGRSLAFIITSPKIGRATGPPFNEEDVLRPGQTQIRHCRLRLRPFAPVDVFV